MSPALRLDKMGVDNVGFLIENLGADAAPLQYLRELVQNEIDAIRAGREDGEIIIDWEDVKGTGVRKLRISGNGIGMSADDVDRYINHLSATSGVQAFDKNFGIGAKITAGARNPHGVMYKCWKDGIGTLTILGRVDGDYGLLPFPRDDGDVDYSMPLTDEDKPQHIRPDGATRTIIDKHGVSVVLLGQNDDDETAAPPSDAELKSQWVSAYLERRYFEIPTNVTLSVLRRNEITDTERGLRRAIYDTIRGQRYYLDRHSEAHDVVELDEVNARVSWWLLSDEITQGGKTWLNRGHVASIFDGELYDVRSGPSRTSALKDFGIYAGFGRIVIYAEPRNVLKPNTSRTALILRGNTPVDYAVLGAAFVEHMPAEIEAFMAGQVSTEPGDHRKAIRRALKEVEDALNEARYRRGRKGVVAAFDADVGGMPAVTYLNGTRRDVAERHSLAADATGRVGAEYLRRAREERERRLKGEAVNADPAPRVVWDKEGKTVPAGRAATYTKGLHVVTASPRFELYVDMVEWGIREAKARGAADMDDTALRAIVEDEIKRWFAQAFTEAVVVLRSFEHDPSWTPDAVFDTALADEGLTAAVVSHRWHMMSAIKRGLAGRLGRTKESTIEAV